MGLVPPETNCRDSVNNLPLFRIRGMWLVEVDARVTVIEKRDDWIKRGSCSCCDMILRADQRQDLEHFLFTPIRGTAFLALN